MFNHKKDNVKKGAPAWMATFSDLMTLLLVFFVLLFSYSEIDASKFRMIANSFKGIFDDQATFILDNPPSSPVENEFPPVDLKKHETDQGSKENEKDRQMNEFLTKINKYLRDYELEGVVSATREKRGVVLVLQENVLFDLGRAVVKEQAKPFLGKVADLIKTLPNMIEVEGHTDNLRIIQPSHYTSNWNLSGDRAANVVNYFINEHSIDSRRFKISGYADTQPIASNATEKGRQKNRRVVIVILDEEIDN
ncbi:hypothetical protein BHF71_11160 [Vulcanibacillus modesticaldus]|uniref:OmpA-like domain-containing protein n=1 Tax=Vulcanibacillus modesticaldus TaxID=337097 RepID=A0A1D2YSM4_9BACI|nr:OmpA family protein [Vulcanibacillus modesticaldus]OEF97586.1 hypothetical protein BHF71_11160 [Vulcanibacillus modesticaldus]